MFSNRPATARRLYGLIGYPLEHSFSPAYFRDKFFREGIDAVYDAFPLENIEALPRLLKAHPQLRGLNITTPHKQAVIPYLDVLSEDAQAIGAVNCIAIKNGKLCGYNTDWTGFRDSLQPLLQRYHTSALVLGNGGASLAVRYALDKISIPFHTVSATEGKADLLYSGLTPEMLQRHSVIINTTVLGTEGIGCPELPYDALIPAHLLYDLVYNPAVTPFLGKGIACGATIKNGQEMLERQATASWRIWNEV